MTEDEEDCLHEHKLIRERQGRVPSPHQRPTQADRRDVIFFNAVYLELGAPSLELSVHHQNQHGEARSESKPSLPGKKRVEGNRSCDGNGDSSNCDPYRCQQIVISSAYFVPDDLKRSPAFQEHPMFKEKSAPGVWNVKYFRRYFWKLEQRVVNRKFHNHVLHWTRDRAESEWDCEPVSVMLSNDEPFAYAEVYRGDVSWGSANYRFDERQIVPWAWREFIAIADDNDTSRERGLFPIEASA